MARGRAPWPRSWQDETATISTEGRCSSRVGTFWRWSREERAREGLFLAFQYPVEIPGVLNTYFLRAALNEVRKHRGEPELDAMDFLGLAREKAQMVKLEEGLLSPAP